MATSQGYFPKGFLPSGNFQRVFCQMATFQMCNLPIDNFPSLSQPQCSAPSLLQLKRSAPQAILAAPLSHYYSLSLRGPNKTFGICCLENYAFRSYHLENCYLGSRPWENSFGKLSNTVFVKALNKIRRHKNHLPYFRNVIYIYLFISSNQRFCQTKQY